MKFNMRQATWVFAISAALLSASGFAAAQDDRDRHGSQQYGVPAGGYAQSCQDIRTDGSTLVAKCKTRDGNWNQTSLPNFNQCADQIENDDGRLVCNKGNNGQVYRGGDQPGDRRDNPNVQADRSGDHHDDAHNDQPGNRGDDHQAGRRDADDHHDRDGIPRGGYTQSCRDIHTVGTTLQATCQKKNGKWRQASLRRFNQCVGEIENNNGKLVCSR
ncbi:MAG TPA: CVNH domain-containing protein [Candidatus Angelobacter sp.]|nr:CVNH domain-containing protein [Candidatus Angelobacter sp.]